MPAANVYPLPEDIPRAWGTIVEPLSCAVHALDRLQLQPGDDALLYGAGTMGLILQQLLGHAGASRVDVIDRNSDRLAIAGQLGTGATANSA